MGLSSGALSIPCLQGSWVQFNHFGEEKGNWIIALIVVFAFFRFTQQFFSSPLCNIHPLEDAGEEGEGDSTGGSNESGERCETETCLPKAEPFTILLFSGLVHFVFASVEQLHEESDEGNEDLDEVENEGNAANDDEGEGGNSGCSGGASQSSSEEPCQRALRFLFFQLALSRCGPACLLNLVTGGSCCGKQPG